MPRVRVVRAVRLRPIFGGHLTLADLDRVSFRVPDGASVIVELIGVTSWGPGVAEAVGRHLAGASAIDIRGSAGDVETFAETVLRAAEDLRQAEASISEP